MMKIRFYFVWSHAGKDMYGHEQRLWRASDLIEAPPETVHMYSKYLLSALSTDFPSDLPQFSEEVIEAIELIEQGRTNEYTWEGDGFTHTITADKVTFEHTIFGECPEWPIWACPLSHYKAALLGWRQFVDMPKAIDTELIVKLPEIA